MAFDTPEDFEYHMEVDHDPDVELLKELGVEWVDDLPPKIQSIGFSLDDRVLALLEKQPGKWMRVWTAENEADGKTRANKRQRLMKLYPNLEVRTGRTLNSWSLFARWMT